MSIYKDQKAYVQWNNWWILIEKLQILQILCLLPFDDYQLFFYYRWNKLSSKNFNWTIMCIMNHQWKLLFPSSEDSSID